MIGKEHLPQTEINKMKLFDFTNETSKEEIATYLKSEGLEDVFKSHFNKSIWSNQYKFPGLNELLEYVDELYQVVKQFKLTPTMFEEDGLSNRNNFIVFWHLMSRCLWSSNFNNYQHKSFINAINISFDDSFKNITTTDIFLDKLKSVNPQITKEKLLDKAQKFKYFTRVFGSVNPFIEWNEKEEVLKTIKIGIVEKFDGMQTFKTDFPKFSNTQTVDKFTLQILNIYFDIDRTETIAEVRDYLAGRIHSSLKQKAKKIYVKDPTLESVKSGNLPLSIFSDKEIMDSFNGSLFSIRKNLDKAIKLQSYSDQERFLKLYLDWIRISEIK